jgi:hypothetical protein
MIEKLEIMNFAYSLELFRIVFEVPLVTSPSLVHIVIKEIVLTEFPF